MKKTSYIVGLTGGIGCGKSTVAAAFKSLGIHSVDADYASRAVIQPGMPALKDIGDRFGRDIILPNGQLDRAKLRQIIFQKVDEKTWLETLLHPLILNWIIEQLGVATSPYVLLESPLLFETDQDQLVDTVLLVDLPVPLQLQRAALRDDNDPAQIQRIIDSQMSREDKLARADCVFDNSPNQETITDRVDVFHEKFLALANTSKEKQPL
ncbi:MAG: dephospho-CoA kinase [Proteobacteria bacterium]|nr:dephospho-CoA kinase [Pseudomonadota bacterium]MDA1350707.1 dephospho-CoA kinase [Pseudomonadota bacterium]